MNLYYNNKIKIFKYLNKMCILNNNKIKNYNNKIK